MSVQHLSVAMWKRVGGGTKCSTGRQCFPEKRWAGKDRTLSFSAIHSTAFSLSVSLFERPMHLRSYFFMYLFCTEIKLLSHSQLTDLESESCCLAFHLFIWQASLSPFIEFRLRRSGSGEAVHHLNQCEFHEAFSR